MSAKSTSPKTTESPVRLAAETWESLFRAQVAVMRRLQAGPAFKRLAVNEYDVLFTLSRCPSGWLRLNELNDHVLLSQSSLSRLVERLEKRGLVERTPAPTTAAGSWFSSPRPGGNCKRRSAVNMSATSPAS
ncbi:MAG: transcriptional regulator [Arthrobacter sp.]|nr:transcriptional regulator [Arthrobacter sp.]